MSFLRTAKVNTNRVISEQDLHKKIHIRLISKWLYMLMLI